MDRRMNERINNQMKQQTDEWTDEQDDKQKNIGQQNMGLTQATHLFLNNKTNTAEHFSVSLF